jgi:putative pyruvate formate lyase activating enzyme
MIEPGYLALHRSGELSRRIEIAWAMLAHCELCPHRCGVNRLDDEQSQDRSTGRGICRSGYHPRVSSWNLHRWEEPPISGTRGSGAIFFSGCTGRCLYCQNYPISQLRQGAEVSTQRLAEMMLELQRQGAHNINLVTPTQFMPQILAALPAAIAGGLCLPLVYNTSGYECVEALRLLRGVVDLWLPDAKYADDAVARHLSGFEGYVEANRSALREIFRQVGHELILDHEGIAVRGMIIRHLVLPEELAGTSQVLSWISQVLSPHVHVSLMDQYFPAHRALDHPSLGRSLTFEEYKAAQDSFEAAGLENGWHQTTLQENTIRF